MAFLIGETGFERDAIKLVLDREPRDFSRFNNTGPARVKTTAITGSKITTLYHQVDGEQEMKIALEQLTEAKTIVLRGLADDPDPLTFKKTAGVSTLHTVTISAIVFDPIIGHYTDGAPVRIKYHRVELDLEILEVIP